MMEACGNLYYLTTFKSSHSKWLKCLAALISIEATLAMGVIATTNNIE
jgi:hypothetical protein